MPRDLINGLLNMNIGQVNEKKVGIVYLDLDEVLPSDDNFYHIHDDDIKMMAYAIEAVGQIEQPLLVKKIADSDKYELIAGHKRRAGANYLVEQGKGEYRTLPCIVKDESIENELSLILTNSTQRELTSFEKMKQVEILRNYIEKYEKIEYAIVDLEGNLILYTDTLYWFENTYWVKNTQNKIICKTKKERKQEF